MLDFDFINLWLHVISLCFYFGTVAVFLFLVLPIVSRIEDQGFKTDFLVRGLRIYNPAQIGSLGVLVMSGAFNLTKYKEKGLDLFLGSFGANLAWKLGLVFFLVILSVYQTMAIAHRAVRQHQSNQQALALEPLIKRIRTTSWAILFLTLVVTFMGLMLTHK